MLRVSILFVNTFIMVSRIFGINGTNILRRTLIFDDKMPSAYIDKQLHISDNLKKSAFSIEHIFPKSMMRKKDHNDMHNVIRTLNNLNVNRSNYRFSEAMIHDKHWHKLDYDNYVNHKLQIFVPNEPSRGFISRAILYMSKEYDYKPETIIDKHILIKWFYEFPPDIYERYHNEVIKKIQKRNNIFISHYNRKNKALNKYLEEL